MTQLFPNADAFTEIGPYRNQNEDAYLLDPGEGLFAVADGLGGLPGGREASQYTLRSLSALCRRHPVQKESDLEAVFSLLQEDVREEGQRQFIGGFGTTLTLILILGSEVLIGHVGDSSAWLFRDEAPGLKLTIDHTVAQKLRDEGWKGPGNPQNEHVLTQCIGQEGRVIPFLLRLHLQPNDRLLLLSDGVTGGLNLSTTDLRSRGFSAKDYCLHAYAGGSTDNATAIVLDFKTTTPEDTLPLDEGPLIAPPLEGGPQDR